MLKSVHEKFKGKSWFAPGWGQSLALMVVDADPFPARTLFEQVGETTEIRKVVGALATLVDVREIPRMAAQSWNAPHDRTSELVTFLR